MQGQWLYRSFYVAALAFAASAWALPPTAEVDLDAIQARSSQVPPNAPPADASEAKLHAQLRETIGAQSRGALAKESHLPGTLLRGEQVLVEIRFRADEHGDDALALLQRHGATPANQLSDALHEAWMPVDRLTELAAEGDVVYVAPARLVHRVIGSKTSEGVAAGNANLWQNFNPAYTGTGIKIALIDTYNSATINSLQASNDWPPNTRLTKNDYKTYPPPPNPDICTTHGFGCMGVRHGNGTMEVTYDVAPAASYTAYDTLTVGDWRNAILNAANVSTTGATLGAVRSNVISESLAAPLDGKGDGSALPGSIAEAAGFAKARGVLVVSAAGNERQNHWGGPFSPQTGGSGFHSWSGTNTQFNPFGPDTASVYCYPVGTEIDVQMYWSNWVPVGSGPFASNHNYDLYLYQLSSSGTWLNVTSSTNLQSGGTGQTPQEFIQYTTTGGTSSGCAANTAAYAIAVARVVGTTATCRYSPPPRRAASCATTCRRAAWIFRPIRRTCFPSPRST
jgi:hypothetical protein